MRHSKGDSAKIEQIMDITWREFEKLVTKLEKALFPIGAIIKTPDKLKDNVTGQLREVDGSIHFKSKNKETLITIECRKRGQKQDITWIEQLVTKRKSLNADKTIAVSSKGFSKSAKILAEQNSIILKTLGEIDPVTVAEWLIPKSIVNLFREIKLGSLTVTYNEKEHSKTYSTDNLDDTSFFDRNKTLIPIVLILGSIEDYLSAHRPDILFSAPLDGSSKQDITLNQKLSEGELYLKMDQQFISVNQLRITIELCYVHTITDVEQGRHYIYDSNQQKFQVSEFDSTNDKLPFTFRHIADTKSETHRASFELKKTK